ncbi:hypothetical protein [Brucella sp. IR073]|uniref:hypothetical protein n=1 Tax=unclassified Brucella TaxID=2632610 RepID=UPI003B9801CB
MNRADAEASIKSLFDKYRISHSVIPTGKSSHVQGKVYELYVLTKVVEYLQTLGYKIDFSNPNRIMKFKTKGGYLRSSDPHFEVSIPGNKPVFDIYVDVEFQTLGSSKISHSGSFSADLSHHHEIDVGVYVYGLDNVRPRHDQVALAVECKAVVSLEKAVIRGMLGLRRELSLLDPEQASILTQSARYIHNGTDVPANPPSEVWLVSTDQAVKQYRNSPKVFGIECRHEDI